MLLSDRVDTWLRRVADLVQRSRFADETDHESAASLVRVAARLAKASATSAKPIAALVREWARQRSELTAGQQLVHELSEELRALRREPGDTALLPAVFLSGTTTAGGARAVVWREGQARSVAQPAFQLSFGEIVWLGHDATSIVGRASGDMPIATQVATVDRVLPDGRLLVNVPWAQHIVRPAASLAKTAVSEGDVVRIDPQVGIAFERLPKADQNRLFLEDTPRETLDDVGGLDREIGLLTRLLSLHIHHPGAAKRYGVRPVGSVLLSGPTGTGKTLIARAIANWLRQHSASGRARFMPVKPGQLHSMWWAESERLYREVFRTAREASEADPETPVVIFFDEVDGIGHARGAPGSDIADRVLTSLLAELDGFTSRGNVLVIAATNRRDALDPALVRPGRLGDLVLEIPRPNRSAARSILEKHIPATTPCASTDARSMKGARQQILDKVVDRLYPSSAEGAEVATLVFANGTSRSVRAAEILGGANLASVARRALERACFREVRGGAAGLTEADVIDAAREELDTVVSALTPAGCRSVLTDLPVGVDVLRVVKGPGRSSASTGAPHIVWAVNEVGQS